MSDRTQYQVQLRAVKRGFPARIHSHVVRGTADDAWEPGYVLTRTEGGRAATLPTTIDDNISGPVAYLAIEAFTGDGTKFVGLEEIDKDTVFEAQIASGSADLGDVFKQGRLIQDATTGHYAVNLDATDDASLEVVDVEPNFAPWHRRATGDYNLVWFKFLPAVLDIAPASTS